MLWFPLVSPPADERGLGLRDIQGGEETRVSRETLRKKPQEPKVHRKPEGNLSITRSFSLVPPLVLVIITTSY